LTKILPAQRPTTKRLSFIESRRPGGDAVEVAHLQLANYRQHRHIYHQYLTSKNQPCWHHRRRRSGDEDRHLLSSRKCVGGHTLGAAQHLRARSRRQNEPTTLETRASNSVLRRSRRRCWDRHFCRDSTSRTVRQPLLAVAGAMGRRRGSDRRSGGLYAPIGARPIFKLGHRHRKA
jgi:hypothetical protein